MTSIQIYYLVPPNLKKSLERMGVDLDMSVRQANIPLQELYKQIKSDPEFCRNEESINYKHFLNLIYNDINLYAVLEDKIAGYLGNFNALVASTGSNAGFNTTFTPNVPNYFVGGVNDIITGSYEYQRLIYHSIQELYYSNYTTCQYGDPDTQPILIPGANSAGDVYIGSTSSQAHYFNYL